MRPMSFKPPHKQKNNKYPNIAVVSLSGIFPGASTPDRFITNILDKKDAVIRVPDQRWAAPVHAVTRVSPDRPLPDRAGSDRAGLIKDFWFDPDGFKLPEDLLVQLDPVHHLVLSAGRDALAGCRISREMKKRTGIILAAIALPTPGANRITRDLFCTARPTLLSRAQALAGSMVSTPANILAAALGLEGGSFTLDAACASSLFAIKLACEQLIHKKADVMVAGGVSRPDSLYTQVGFTQLQALSPTGRCAPFDKNADGLVVGEGAGLIVLKRIEDALADKDTIHAVIKGWGVSNDIEGNLVAPASDGQIRAMAGAYGMAGWSLADIQYMECHGSGTPKGDGVELASIKALADETGSGASPLAIGSVKSMIGHLLTAAGAAGFIKTIMAMNRHTLPPSLNFTGLPDNSPIRNSGIRVQSHAAPWERPNPSIPRRAGISAFGFGGINAHILVEEFKPHRSVHPVPASATPVKEIPCAIVGMGALSGGAKDLNAVEALLFGPDRPSPSPAGDRWRRTAHLPEEIRTIQTLFLEEIALDIGEFQIPPNQIRDVLPQHLAMLKAARAALEDARIDPRPDQTGSPRHKMGCVMGIEFDFGATDFFLRWTHHNQPGHILDQIGSGLNFDRTLGALGGIVASRIARAFKLGGPCFTLSAGAGSGLKAIDIGCRSLGSGETDIVICGAVDMAGDIRSFTRDLALSGIDPNLVFSEGAGAIVLKRLDQALEDRDRIYAVVRGTGSSSAALDERQKTRLYARSLDRALKHAKKTVDGLSLITTGHTGAHPDGLAESRGIAGTGAVPPPLFCPATALGNTGAASGMFSTIAAALSLFRNQFFKAMDKTKCPGDARYTAVGSITPDGGCSHLILAYPPAGQSPKKKTTAPPPNASIRVSLSSPPLPREIREQNIEAAREPLTLVTADSLAQTQAITARAHERFLEFSSRNMDAMARQLTAIARTEPATAPPPEPPACPPPFLDRDQCLEYAVGKAGNVLGPEFDIIDTYPVRVRLPAEPLMLVDRIMEIQGEMLSLTSGKIVTQHDVHEGAWYLDGNRAPVSISIEAGQADLFLCAWMGIDHRVKGRRKYRLLDAKVTFHRSLPAPGETIEYHIEIDRFLKQGEIYLFFFHYKGYIDGLPFISMRDGCAGFFTEQEVENSGGIILKKEDREIQPGLEPVAPLTEMARESYSDSQVEALRRGDLETAFGPAFKGRVPGRHQWLPGGRMTLIHRVLDLAPRGGRFGLGRIIAEADIHPDDWFLTCHFVDDMVMPGTLMYECCAHALRIFIQRMGWISPDASVHYDVLPNNESDLKCRGPVTRETKKARYDIEIKEMGYSPEPYVIADAHMYSDDLEIVFYKDMGMKLAGVSLENLAAFWRIK